MKIILDVDEDDLMLGVRAATWLLKSDDRTDGIVAYGERAPTKDFYVKRNKASITVRRCYAPND